MFGVMLRKREHKIIALIIVLFLLGVGGFLFLNREEEVGEIVNFEECIAAGYSVMESYPRQCRDGEGNLHVEEIDYPLNPEG